MHLYETVASRAGSAAERLLMEDLINAFIVERFFLVDGSTAVRLADAPELAARYPGEPEALAYAGDALFLVQPSRRQGYQWTAGTPVYLRDDGGWTEVVSPVRLAQAVLGAEAYPGTDEFLLGLETAVWQLELSLAAGESGFGAAPASASASASSYEWYALAERIASLRDRPYHPSAKAKVGFTKADYERYMAEFGRSTALHWVAIANGSVVRGSPEDPTEALDALDEREREAIERELEGRGLSRERYTALPVHPWQLENKIRPDFQRELADGTIVVLETQAGDYRATSSLRSMTTPHDPLQALKLPVSVASLGAARYLPVVKLLNGLGGERMFRQALACDDALRDQVYLCEEHRWWGYMPAGMGLFDEHPRHLAAQLRLYPRELMQEGVKVIPMAALGVTRRGDRGASHLLSALCGNGVTPEQALRFYERTAALFYDTALRLFKVGIVPELHGQNCCLVLRDDEPAALLFRDHDSVRLHQPYLDRHGIADPEYRIRPGFSNSLYNETPEKLMYYIQTLGTQVNLASIMDALSTSYGVPVDRFWDATGALLREALERVDIPEADKIRLRVLLFDSETWPVKLVVRPLLETEGVPGAMPSGKGVGPNPFRP